MVKKLSIFLIVCFVAFFIIFWINHNQNTRFIQKFEEKLIVSDYQGAIAVAKEWGKESYFYNTLAVFALANAYSKNFEPQKAASIAKQHVANMLHAEYNKKEVARGYSNLAMYDCIKGSYDQFHKDDEKVLELDPGLYKIISYERYSCRGDELIHQKLTKDPAFNQKILDAFKEEVTAYINKSQEESDMNGNAAKAILALRVVNDKPLALKFAKKSFVAAEKQAEIVFSDKSKIRFSTRHGWPFSMVTYMTSKVLMQFLAARPTAMQTDWCSKDMIPTGSHVFLLRLMILNLRTLA